LQSRCQALHAALSADFMQFVGRIVDNVVSEIGLTCADLARSGVADSLRNLAVRRMQRFAFCRRIRSNQQADRWSRFTQIR
jgi:hypothetical protein